MLVLLYLDTHDLLTTHGDCESRAATVEPLAKPCDTAIGVLDAPIGWKIWDLLIGSFGDRKFTDATATRLVGSHLAGSGVAFEHIILQIGLVLAVPRTCALSTLGLSPSQSQPHAALLQGLTCRRGFNYRCSAIIRSGASPHPIPQCAPFELAFIVGA